MFYNNSNKIKQCLVLHPFIGMLDILQGLTFLHITMNDSFFVITISVIKKQTDSLSINS